MLDVNQIIKKCFLNFNKSCEQKISIYIEGLGIYIYIYITIEKLANVYS